MGKEKFQIRIRMPEWFEAPSYVASYKRFRPINQLRRKSATKVADLLKFALKSNKVGRVILDHPTELFEFIFQDSLERMRYAIAYRGMLKYLFPQSWRYMDFDVYSDMGIGSPIVGIGDFIKLPEGAGSIFNFSPMPQGVEVDIIGWYGSIKVLDPNPIIWALKHCPRFALWAERNYIEFTKSVMDAGFSRTDALLMLSSIIHSDEEFGNIVEMVSMTFKFTSDRDFSILAANQLLLKRVGFRYVEDVGILLGIAGTKFFYGVISNFQSI